MSQWQRWWAWVSRWAIVKYTLSSMCICTRQTDTAACPPALDAGAARARGPRKLLVSLCVTLSQTVRGRKEGPARRGCGDGGFSALGLLGGAHLSARRRGGPGLPAGCGGLVDAVPRGGKLHLRVHACVTVCEHLVGGGGMRVRLCSLGPTTERAGGQPAASQDGDPCVSSEGKEKQRKNENSKVRAGLAGEEEGAGHGRCPRLPLDGRLVNKLDWFSSEQVKRPGGGCLSSSIWSTTASKEKKVGKFCI